jgi:hypothetical protein
MILAASAGQILLLIVAVVCVVSLGTWLLKRRRRDVWHALARERGLRFRERGREPHLTGQLQGRRVEVATDDSSSDHDVGGVVVVKIRAGLRGVPPQMTVAGIPGLVGDVATLMEDRITFSEEDFDRHVVVKGQPEEEIRRYWTRSRQERLLELIEHAPCDQVAMEEGSIVAEERDIVSDPAQLNTLLDLLLDAAPILDAAGEHR